jgi:hypothetical protein
MVLQIAGNFGQARWLASAWRKTCVGALTIGEIA